MKDIYDMLVDKEIEDSIKTLESELRVLKAMQKLNNEGRMRVLTTLFELAHTEKYMKKEYARIMGGA